MTEPAQSDFSPEQISGLFQQLSAQPIEFQATVLEHVTSKGITAPQEIAEVVAAYLADLNQQSVANEASLIQGGYAPEVANALGASVGIGTDQETVDRASTAFALDALRAIQNGQPLDQVRTADPNLSLAAQAAIYEQVANQQGTSTQQIEAKAEAARQADMQAIQGMVFGAAASQTSPLAVLIGGQQMAEPMDYRDMGSTTAALAFNDFTPTAGLPGLERGRDQGIFSV